MSTEWFFAEWERALAPPGAVRVDTLSGAGSRRALLAVAEALRAREIAHVFTDGTHVGVSAGGGVESLVRGLLGLPDDAPSAWARLEAQTLESDVQGRELLAFAAGIRRGEGTSTARLDVRTRWEGALAELARWISRHDRPWAWLITDAHELDTESVRLLGLIAGLSHPALVILGCEGASRAEVDAKFEALVAAKVLGALTHVESAGSAPPRPLPDDARPVLEVLEACGGRLPMSGLQTMLPDATERCARLHADGLVGLGRTRRSGDEVEVWASRKSALGAVPPAVGAWAEQRLLTGTLEGARGLYAPLVIRAAEQRGDPVRQSLGWELLAREGRVSECLPRAEATAVGVRRLVLARRVAEDAVFRGDLKKAQELLAAAARLPSLGVTELPSGWAEVLAADTPDELERWQVLTGDEALAAIDLARAEVLSQLAQIAETRRAFLAVEARLAKLKPSPATSALWLRTARTWSWFAAEMLGDGALARSFCERAREKAGPQALVHGFHAPAFLRAAQIAESHGGDPVRARSLADELIEVARARGDVRDECVAWNARSILSLRDGELLAARKGFETSLNMARSIGFRRREAVALHNLGLTLAAAGEFSDSVAAQESYSALSEQIGNTAAGAYAPAAMAQALVMQLETARAEPLIARARRAAEDNQWTPLIAWTRHLTGLLKLLAWTQRKETLLLTQARLEFLACLDLLEERGGGWAEEVDPAEVAACLSVCWLAAGQRAQADGAAQRAFAYEQESACSAANVRALRALLAGEPLDDSLHWMEEKGQLRLAQLWRRVVAAVCA